MTDREKESRARRDAEALTRDLQRIREHGLDSVLRARIAEQLVTWGWTYLAPGERVVRVSDGPLVSEAVAAWERAKRVAHEAATVGSDESEPTVDVKSASAEALLIAAFAGAGRPLSSREAIRAAAGWHLDYQAGDEDWDRWRGAMRSLITSRHVVKTTRELGLEALWTLPAGQST